MFEANVVSHAPENIQPIAERDDRMRDNCFICGLDRQTFDREGKGVWDMGKCAGQWWRRKECL
jgi:ribosomal protein L37AE/L43A